MGDRGHIVVHGHDDTPVVLYTHWGATRLPETCSAALALETRWNDPEYLTRIIADHLSARARETTGMGIGTSVHSDAWRVIDVYPTSLSESNDAGTVAFRGDTGHHPDEYAGERYTFDEFVDAFRHEVSE